MANIDGADEVALQPAMGIQDDQIEIKENIEPAPKRQRGRPRGSETTKALAENLEANEITADQLRENLQKQLKKKDDECKASKKNIDQLNKQIAALNDTATTLTASKTEADKKIASKDKMIQKLEQDLTQQDAELDLLNEDNDDKEKKITELSSRLDEKEREYQDLIELVMADSPAKPTKLTKPKQSALVLVDNITEALIPYLPNDIKWIPIKKSPLRLSEDSSLLINHDMIFLLYGTQVLNEGENWNQLLGSVSKLMDVAMKASCVPVAIHLPPADKRSLAGKLSLFNYKLDKAGHKVISATISHLSKYDFVEADGITISKGGAELFCKIISDEIISAANEIPDTPKPTATTSTATSIDNLCTDLKIYLDIKKDDIGKIIGKGGHVIKKLCADNDVIISVGKWYEKARGMEEYKEVCDGVLVSGRSCNVMQAKKEIIDRCDTTTNK